MTWLVLPFALIACEDEPLQSIQAPLSTDATLGALSVSASADVQLSPMFNPNLTSYTATVPAELDELSVIMEVNDLAAYAEIGGVKIENGQPHRVELLSDRMDISVLVMAEDGQSSKTYKISVVQEEEEVVNEIFDGFQLRLVPQGGAGTTTEIDAAEGDEITFDIVLEASAQDEGRGDIAAFTGHLYYDADHLECLDYTSGMATGAGSCQQEEGTVVHGFFMVGGVASSTQIGSVTFRVKGDARPEIPLTFEILEVANSEFEDVMDEVSGRESVIRMS